MKHARVIVRRGGSPDPPGTGKMKRAQSIGSLRRKLSLAFLVLLSLKTALAQPWQWELYEGDFYNPTGFVSPSRFPNPGAVAIGDFNGDGRDDFIGIGEGSFTICMREDSLHWHCTQGSEDFNYPDALWARDLDADSADELVGFSWNSVTCWKATDSSDLVWQRRDDLLAGLYTPPELHKAIYGDYDSDGLLNALCWFNQGDCLSHLCLYERGTDGTWSLDSALFLEDWPFDFLYDGDLDHDGDLDFGIGAFPTDIPTLVAFGENTPQGLVTHVLPPFSTFGACLGGGDLDGDGQWEGLFLYIGYVDCHQVEVEPSEETFIQAVSFRYLGVPAGPVIGNFRTPHGTNIAALRSWAYGDPFFVMDAFALMEWSPTGWTDYDNGFDDAMGFQCIRANTADLNGDGRKDIVAVLVDYQMYGVVAYDWGLYPNRGNDSVDLYAARVRLGTLFLHNPDTAFSWPCIGDISGDGRAELAVLAQTSNNPRQVLFYEYSGEFPDTTFALRPEWSAGLPTGFARITLADIDGDSFAELIGYLNGQWRACFRRNGVWTEYPNVLPAFTSNAVSFADADGDGDLDLFTDSDVYLCVARSSVGGFRVPPSSFLLSASPNPFNPSTRITLSLPQSGRVEIEVFDILGQKVRDLLNDMLSPGEHSVWFDGSALPSGLYIARVSTPHHQAALKLLLLR
jgi:hypothetical protein